MGYTTNHIHNSWVILQTICIIHEIYCQVSNIRCTLVGNEIADHSDVVGASPVGATPTTSSFSTEHLASIYCAKTDASRVEKHLSFGIWGVLYFTVLQTICIIYGMYCIFSVFQTLDFRPPPVPYRFQTPKGAEIDLRLFSKGKIQMFLYVLPYCHCISVLSRHQFQYTLEWQFLIKHFDFIDPSWE